MKPIVTGRGSLAVLALVAAAGGLPSAVDAAPPAEPYAPAAECAQCHQPIHTYWSESEHARAATKPSYLAALGAAVEGSADKPAVRQGCVWCHAPTALVTGDYELRSPIAREGVTCDFCHTVADVDLSKRDHPFDLRPGAVKRGPWSTRSRPITRRPTRPSTSRALSSAPPATSTRTPGASPSSPPTASGWAGPTPPAARPARNATCRSSPEPP